MPARLNLENLSLLAPAVVLPSYDIASTGIGIVHIGPGAFHRAHQAVYTHSVLEELGGDWGICAVSMNSSGVAEALRPQDGLYTLAVLDNEVSYQLVGSICEVLVARDNMERVLERISAPGTRAVTLTITEKGYCLGSDNTLDLSREDIRHDIGDPDHPHTALGVLVAGLRRCLNQNTRPPVILSCDNLDGNGHKLRSAVLGLAGAIDEKLATWIEEKVAFPCTMVDSITPATDEQLRETIADFTGLEDAWPIQREAFCQWVIEDVPGVELPPWDKVGAILAADVEAFEKVKLRVLNASHTALACLGSLSGHETVFEAVSDSTLRTFLIDMLESEVLPTLPQLPGLSSEEYVDEMLQRFHNPHIKHRLAQIFWDSSAKIPIRILGTAKDLLNSGRRPRCLALVVAGWIRLVEQYCAAGEALVDPQGEYLGKLAAAPSGAVSPYLELLGWTAETGHKEDLFAADVQRSYELLGPDGAGMNGIVESIVEAVR